MKSAPPIFILCHARNGSTLLRYVLDTHHSIFCPPEMHLGKLMSTMYTTVVSLRSNSSGAGSKDKILTDINQHIHNLMAFYANTSKTIWCDKSISTINHLPLVKSIFPDASYICLYRHCLDFVHSAIEANSFNGKGYGLEEYLEKSTTNIFDTLVGFWCEQVTKILEFEESKPAHCFSIRIEAMIEDPKETIKKLFAFLGLEIDEDFSDKIFDTPHQVGAGDFKILSSNKFDKNAIGKGRFIPVNKISELHLKRMNILLIKLGYKEVTPDWNTSIPPHLYYGSKNEIVKAYSTGMVEEIFQDFIPRLKSIAEYKKSSKENCLIKITDIENGIYEVSLNNPFIRKVKNIRSNKNRIYFSFNTLTALVNEQVNFSLARLKGDVVTEGDIDVIRIFSLLFN